MPNIATVPSRDPKKQAAILPDDGPEASVAKS